MQVKDLRLKRALRAALLVLLLSAVGMGKMYAEWVGHLEFSINPDGVSVTLVGGDEQFYEMDSLVVPSSVTLFGPYGEIGTYEVTAIGGASPNLTYVWIPNTVDSIGDGAFYGHENLTSVEFEPNSSLRTIGEFAFSYCTSLPSIDFGPNNSLTTIGEMAFYMCTNLLSVDFGNSSSSTNIGPGAFLYCENLASIEIPNTVNSIGKGAFYGCVNLTSVEFESNSTLITIGESAFHSCESLTAIEIPNSVVSIGDFAFDGCSLSSVEFEAPSSLQSIGKLAFGGANYSVEIPNSVISIGFEAFLYVNHISVAPGNPVFDSRSNCDAVIRTNTNELVVGCKNTIIPHSVTSIGDYAFSLTNTSSIMIPNSVTAIGKQAFRAVNFWWGGLSVEFELPSSLLTIADSAFMDTPLYSIEIPNSVDSIGKEAFTNTGLRSVVIGESVTYIGRSAFSMNGSLASVVMQAANPPELANCVFSGNDNSYQNNHSFTIYENDFTIYVPYESLNAYKTAEYWNDYEPYIKPMFTPSLSGYASSTSNDKWTFIALPLANETDPATVLNLIAEDGGYDLYQFDQSAAGEEWRNYKANSFNLVNGRGYLYATAVDVNLVIGGDFNEDETKEVSLDYDAGKPFAGWNLVGNPFPIGAYINRSYYVMNATGSGIEPMAISSSIPVPVCTGVMVKAEASGESVTFNRTAPSNRIDLGRLQIELTESTPNRDGVSTGSTTLQDKAIISFNAGDRLEKYVFNKDNARISIPQGGKDLAIACTDKQGEMPLDFRATKNGTYTLSVDVENANVDYLHLIDNLTGADIDLLAFRQAQRPAEYTFTAKTSDYASRFRLVFSVCGDADGDDVPFAFINNGDIIIIGAEAGAVLQIVDVLGHVIVSTDVACNVSTNGMTPGVYVLRLINGNDIKTQKIVID